MNKDTPKVISDEPCTASENEAIRAERERCAAIADAMANDPWGGEHESITPRHLAEQIAAAIRSH